MEINTRILLPSSADSAPAAAHDAPAARKIGRLLFLGVSTTLTLCTFVLYTAASAPSKPLNVEGLLATAQLEGQPSAKKFFVETIKSNHAHMLHDISVASQHLIHSAKQLKPRDLTPAQQKAKAKVIDKQWPLVKYWTLAPDEHPTQSDSSNVAREANQHVSARGRDETEGKWTTPCKAWPFSWPFSPCKEKPPPANTKAPTYEIIVNFFKDGSVSPTAGITHAPTFQGACTRCLKIPPVPPPKPTLRPTTAAPVPPPTAAPSSSLPSYSPDSLTVEITLPSKAPTSAAPTVPATPQPTAAPLRITSAPTLNPDTLTVEVNQYASGTPPGAVSARVIIPQPHSKHGTSSAAALSGSSSSADSASSGTHSQTSS